VESVLLVGQLTMIRASKLNEYTS